MFVPKRGTKNTPRVAASGAVESRVGEPGEPIAVRCALGWTIYGPYRNKHSSHPFLGLHRHRVDQELNEMIRQQFVLEDTGINPVHLLESKEDARARKLLETTTDGSREWKVYYRSSVEK